MNLGRRQWLIAAGLVLALPAPVLARPSVPRRLTLHNGNTGENFTGPYRDEKGPLPSALADLKKLLRDHHSGETTPVNLGALDFLADVLDAVGQSKATVLSAYRSPQTNAMLIAAGYDAAEHSQHLQGHALDVTFDRRLTEAMQAARLMERGGVGWYPRQHFIHLDVGPVRWWQNDKPGAGRAKARKPGPPTVQERMAMHRALAKKQMLARRSG